MKTRLNPDRLNRTRTKESFDKQRAYGALIMRWLPVVAWTSLIFFFSTEHFSSDNTAGVFDSLLSPLLSGISAEAIEIIHAVIRKLGHWTEYGVLSMLLLWALKNDSDRVWEWRHACWTLGFVLMYAISDELHQSFVPSRTASVGDVMIDVFGGICGTLWTFWYRTGIGAPLNGRVKSRHSISSGEPGR
jgi:VanZ family protein